MAPAPLDPSRIDPEGLPWMPFVPYSDRVSVKLYRADPVSGAIIAVLRAPPGCELPRCHHAGTLTIYTVQGRWKYREYDWVAGPGSVVIEHPTAQHTPQTLSDGTDDVILFIQVQGEILMQDESGEVIGTESWRTALDRYLEYCRDQGLEPRDITGREP